MAVDYMADLEKFSPATMEERATATQRKMQRGRPAIINGIVGGILMVALVVGGMWVFLRVEPAAVADLKREIGPVRFFIALAILPGLGLPTTPFFVLAGATFSPWVNVVGISLSLAAHVTMCYWLARSWLRTWLVCLLNRFGYKMPHLQDRDALRLALLIKMAPGLPTFLKNYAIGMSGISFWPYFLVTFGVTGCYAAVFATMGDSIMERDFGTGIISAALFIVIIVGLYFIRQRLRVERVPGSAPIARKVDVGQASGEGDDGEQRSA